MSDFIPNDYINVQTKDLPWIIIEIKRLIKKQNRLLDRFKAFGKVWHEGLLLKLKQNGISGQVLDKLFR